MTFTLGRPDAIILSPDDSLSVTESIAIHTDKVVFYLSPGHYLLTEPIKLNRNNLQLIGLEGDVLIEQTTLDLDAIIVEDCDNVIVDGIQCKVDEGQGIALHVTNSRWVRVTNCHIIGSPTYFAVYVSGPNFAEGAETLEGYNANTLTNNIVFDDNVVHGIWPGDAVAIGLQNGCTIRNNVIRGGKLAVYLCRDTMVTGNKIIDSTSHGIYCSLPSDDLKITNNTIVRPAATAIMLKPQLEHGSVDADPSNIEISHNIIRDGTTVGIEVTDTWNVQIHHNQLSKLGEYGILLVRTQDVQVSKNYFAHCQTGASFIASKAEFRENTIMSFYPEHSKFGILLQDTCWECVVEQNRMGGHFISGGINDFSIMEIEGTGDPEADPPIPPETEPADSNLIGENELLEHLSLDEEMIEI